MRRLIANRMTVRRSPGPALAPSFLVAVLVFVFANVGVAREMEGRDSAWIGTWAAAPQPFMPGSLETFRNQTVRLIVHSSVGGSPLRLRISNTFGDRPLTLGRVHVALRSTGADIEAASARVVTFRGTRSVTVPVGAAIVSDPIALQLPALADLAVSFYFPRETPATTNHFLALQTSYVSSVAGDRTREATFKVGRTISSWPSLTGVEVKAPTSAGAIVVFGDSTVDGDGSTAETNHRWPDVLAQSLNRDAGSKGFGVLNEGIIGNRLLRRSPREPPSEFGDALGECGIARFDRDALGSSVTRIVILRLGINDIGLPGALAPATDAVGTVEIIDGYRKLIAKAHRRGVRITGTTLGPFEGATAGPGYYSPEKEAVRQEVNTWIRDGGEFDSVVDLDIVLRDPEHPSRLLPAFDSGDHLHPNDAGYAASAAAVPRTLFGAH
jgi:lysophospholipase L1-like esterase